MGLFLLGLFIGGTVGALLMGMLAGARVLEERKRMAEQLREFQRKYRG